MNTNRIVLAIGLLLGAGVDFPCLLAIAQTTSSKESQPPARGPPKANRRRRERLALDLDKSVNAALAADRWDEVIARSSELLAFRVRPPRARNTTRRLARSGG